MSPIPEMLSVPIFSALGSGMVPYPTVGAVLAWMVIAAFVGSALGVLREGLGVRERRRVGSANVVVLHAAAGVHARGCPKAA